MAAADHLPNLPDWPALMSTSVAALYCGLGSAQTFRRKVVEWDGFAGPDSRTGMWSRQSIDAWVSGIDEPESNDTWRKELDQWKA